MTQGGGDDPPRVSFVLAEFEDVDGVFLPVKTASRVKYTCFDISRHYVAFGTTAGGVIILQQDSLTYLKTLAVKEGPVCQVAFAVDENMVAFATSRGIVLVMEHNANKGSVAPHRLQLSYDHKGSPVTALQWNISSTKLFVGDSKGKVSVINVTTSRTRNIFQIPTSTLAKLDSKIIQFDFAQDHLLVSTLTRCYLCNTIREHFFQVGKKLRDGDYGACFYPGLRTSDPCTIYSARPGSRMWEVDIRGEVHCTHQFKNALSRNPETLISFRNVLNAQAKNQVENKSHSAAFNKMFLVWPRPQDFPFVFTWSESGTYVFDPKRAEVILWTVEIKGIKDIRCQHSEIYIHFMDGRFAKYSIMTVEQAVCRLYQQGLTSHSSQLLVLKRDSVCLSRLNSSVPYSFLQDMLQQTSDVDDASLYLNLKEIFSHLGISVDMSSRLRRSSSVTSDPMHPALFAANKFTRESDDSQPSFSLSRWRSASPVFSQHSSSPHSSPSRSGKGSPRRRPSESAPTVKLKEIQSKVSTASDMTPDSIDSGASGKMSDISDELPTCPLPVQTKANDPCIEAVESIISNTVEQSVNFLAATNSVNSSILSHEPDLVIKDGTESQIIGQNINLNLKELSQASAAIGKRVSFKGAKSLNDDSTNDADKTDTEETRLNEDLVNSSNGDIKDGHSALDEYYDTYQDALYEETYSYMNMSLYGMMLPAIDFSLLFGADTDYQSIKESLANKLTTGKNMFKRGLEHIKQSQTLKLELLNVKQKSNELVVPTKLVERENSVSDLQERNFWYFLQPTDTSYLVEASKLARSKLRDPDVLFHNENMVQTLSEWINLLYASQKSVFSAINSFCQSSSLMGSHSFQDDDTIKSTCSLVTSTGSSPSENGDPSDRLETEEASISDPKSLDDDKHIESTSSLNTDCSDSSTLKTESLQKLLRIEDFVFVHDPFKLSSDNHNVMSDLVKMCFQCKVWNDIRSVKEIAFLLQKKEITEKSSDSSYESHGPTNNLHLQNGCHVIDHEEDNLTPDFNTSFVFPKTSTPKFSSLCDSNVPNTSSSDSANYSSAMTSKLDSPHDVSASLFLQYFFHFMDIQRLRELLMIQNEPCFLTWTVMMKGCGLLTSKDEFTQKINSGQIDAAANLLERNYSGSVLISHLHRLFRANPSRAIELCLHRSYHVTPLDVLFLARSSNMLPEFMNYVANVIECLSDAQKPKVLDKLLHLDEVRLEWITCTLNDGCIFELKCQCGFPKPGSHLHQWKNLSLLFHIISTSTNLYETLLNLCYENGFWIGFMWLAKKLQFLESLGQVLVQLADVDLMSKHLDYGYVPYSDSEWKQLLLWVGKLGNQKDGQLQCLGCKDKSDTTTGFTKTLDAPTKWTATLNFESAAKVALSDLGPKKVLCLLKEITIPAGTFSAEFYRSIIFTSVIDEQQSALGHRMLTDIGSYLWSKRPSTISPEVNYLFSQKNKEQAQTLSSPEIQTETSASGESFKPYLEEPETHWGMTTLLRAPCESCNMPLTSHLSSSSAGIVVCVCGHTYHNACLPTRICPSCITPHFKDL